MPDSPNVLLLMNDEHRPDVAGFAGNDVVRTPTLNWLAETGTVFTNAYTPAPVCVPARHSVRTGQLPQTWDRFGLEAFESPEYRTLPLQLGRHGYMTASAGKEHYPGWNQMVGWRKRIGATPYLQHGLGDDRMPDPAPGATTGGSAWKWSAKKEVKRAGVSNARQQIGDRRATEGLKQYIREFFSSPYYDRAQPETPVLLKHSLIQPHYPFFTDDEDLFTYYLNRVDPYVEDLRDFHPVISECQTAGECRRVRPGEDASAREIRRATAAYYAMVERVDEMFGRVIETLERHGEDLDEWLIIFTSDHGEMLGERSMWGKGQFLEPSASVPLIVRYPEQFDPRTVEENVTLCDIYATICDLTNTPVPDNRDSRSLVPLLGGDTQHWHDTYDNEAASQGVSNGAVANGISSDELMIKRDDLKYCYFGEKYEEVLFDLDRDPGETTNYIDDSDYAEAVEYFRSRRTELGYGPTAEGYANAGYR